MRKHLRRKARSAMQRLGIHKFNKASKGGKSFFAEHWKEYV